MQNISKRKTLSKKLKEEINFLTNQKKIFDASEEMYEANVWSIKKLILLAQYLRPYLTILTSKENGDYKYSDSWFYIDLFAGCGASTVNNKFKMLGSPIISLLRGIHYIKRRDEYIRFTKWFFIEKDNRRYDALKERVGVALEEIKYTYNYNFSIPSNDVIIYQGDCNRKIDSILHEIQRHKRPSILLFADPEGITEIEWPSISKILSKRLVDIIYILSTGGFKRGLRKEHLEKNLPPLSKEEKRKILSGKYSSEELVNVFMRCILKELGRNRIFYEPLRVCNEKGAEVYRIIWASCSKGAVESIKGTLELIEKASSNDILQAIQVVSGKQKELFG
jgi:three-Cys-motif partner protein